MEQKFKLFYLYKSETKFHISTTPPNQDHLILVYYGSMSLVYLFSSYNNIDSIHHSETLTPPHNFPRFEDFASPFTIVIIQAIIYQGFHCQTSIWFKIS